MSDAQLIDRMTDWMMSNDLDPTDRASMVQFAAAFPAATVDDLMAAYLRFSHRADQIAATADTAQAARAVFTKYASGNPSESVMEIAARVRREGTPDEQAIVQNFADQNPALLR